MGACVADGEIARFVSHVGMVDVGDGGSEQGERERARDGAEAEAEAESVLLLPNETTDWNSHMYRAMQSQVASDPSFFFFFSFS